MTFFLQSILKKLSDLVYAKLCFACEKNIPDINSSLCIHCQLAKFRIAFNRRVRA